MITNISSQISIETKKRPQKIEIINLLRGVAALGVCFFHLSQTFTKYLDTNLMQNLAYYGRYGKYGITIFFVISGFIIPFSLHKRNYKVAAFFKFIKKRLIRLHPPLLAIIGIICVQEYVGTLINPASAFPYSLNQILLNSLLISQYFQEVDFIRSIFWTLAVELEYYILIGLIFSFVVSPKLHIRVIVISVLLTSILIATSFFPSVNEANHLLDYLPLFCLGISIFYYKSNFIKSPYFLICICLFIGLISLNTLSFEKVLFAWIASFLIAFINLEKLPLLFSFLGSVSYSLYLIHTTVGNLVIYYGSKLPLAGNSRLLILFLAISVAIACAYLIYILVEKPCMKYASKLSYGA